MMQSLAHQFLTFCREKPADEAYDYGDPWGCALSQYLKAAGYPVAAVGSHFWVDEQHVHHPLPHVLSGYSSGGPGLINGGQTTFGALADRLSAALGESL